MKHIISFPEGDFVTHAEIIKTKDYSLGDIFEKSYISCFRSLPLITKKIL